MVFALLAIAFCLLCLSFLLLRYRTARGRHFPSSKRQHSSANRASPRISRDPALIRTEYDIVIIGSGYGGGVAASRFARAGKTVCVLEKGAEVLAGQFPHTLRGALRESNIREIRPGRHGSLGKATGLYQTYKGKGQDVFTGSGLGGTSLINAGVFLRADRRILEGPEWPLEIRENTDDLIQYYERGERVFRPSPYPNSLPKPQKLSVFEQQSKDLGLYDQFHRPPLTINFDDGLTGAGVSVRQSTGSGNECTGSNDGSKNSVLVTYLADAWTWGADMFCGVNATHVRKSKHGESYIVYYSLLENHAHRRMMWVRAKELVVLGAGAIGTSEILLRSRSYGLPMSPVVGTRLSGNGDLLAFAYNCNQRVNALGGEACRISHTARCGPTITGCIDMREATDAHNARDGFVVQEGAIPGALGPVIQALLEARVSAKRLYNSVEDTMARVKSWLLGPHTAGGSIVRTAVYLVMSHDENEGTLDMVDGKLTLQWSGIGAGSRVDRIRSLLVRATTCIKGTLVTAPSVTVHPLGGACMSHDSTGLGGVVNHMGQLFSGIDGQTHQGIACIDASIIPTSLGVNPCATITALAERCCELLIRSRGWTVDNRPNEQIDFQQPPFVSQPLSSNLAAREEELRLGGQQGGLTFDETLHGHLQLTNDDCHFETAYKSARILGSSAVAAVTVGVYCTESGNYRGCATGQVSFSALSRDPLLITQGHIDFFTIDEDVSDAVKLTYRLKLIATDGEEYVLDGHKMIDSRVTLSPSRTWAATTTLLTTISEKDGTQVAKGILRLSPRDFISELSSLRCSPKISYVQQACVKARFLGFFTRSLVSYFLSPLRSLQYHESIRIHPDDWKKTRPDGIRIRAADGVEFRVKMWEPSPHVPPKSTPIVLIPGAAVDHQMFSLPTIPRNTIDYFTSQGYRCYVPVLRFGIGSEARNGWTVFDARLDVKAALEYVRAKENNRKIYAIVHCLGSIATATALLQGDIDVTWLCGMTCSQVFTDLIYSNDNKFKASHQSLLKLYKKLAGEWFSCRPSTSTPYIQYALDQILRFYPIGSRKELCNSAVCHRCDLPFGRCWTHGNLNRATHHRLGEFFDGIHMNFLAHLSRMGAVLPYHIRSDQPEFSDLVTPENLQRLAGMKICFLNGSDNAVWEPNATKKSFDTFRQLFPKGRFDRVVVQGYGHLDCWIGKNAFRDVYPRVHHHIKFCEPTSQTKVVDSLI